MTITNLSYYIDQIIKSRLILDHICLKIKWYFFYQTIKGHNRLKKLRKLYQINFFSVLNRRCHRNCFHNRYFHNTYYFKIITMDPILKYSPQIMFMVLDDKLLNKYIFDIDKYGFYLFILCNNWTIKCLKNKSIIY